MQTEPRRAPVTVLSAAALEGVSAAWLIFDGLHGILKGDFVRIEGQLGPWAALAEKAGIEPIRFRYPFVVMGLLWLFAAAGLVKRQKWGWRLGLVMSVITLLYCCIGTLISFVTLILLSLRPTRQYISARRSVGSPG